MKIKISLICGLLLLGLMPQYSNAAALADDDGLGLEPRSQVALAAHPLVAQALARAAEQDVKMGAAAAEQDREKEADEVMRCGVCKDEIAADRTKFGAACRHWFHVACMNSGVAIAQDIKPNFKAIERDAECSICLEEMVDRSVIISPRIGDICGHSFCAKCSHGLIKDKVCPICRSSTTLSRYRLKTDDAAEADKKKLKAELRKAINAELILREARENTCPLCRKLDKFPGIAAASDVDAKERAAHNMQPLGQAAVPVDAGVVDRDAKEMAAAEENEVVGALHCIECERLITPAEAGNVLTVHICGIPQHYVHDKCVRQFVKNGMCLECNRSLSNTEEDKFSKQHRCPEVFQQKRQAERARRGNPQAMRDYRTNVARLEEEHQRRRARRGLPRVVVPDQALLALAALDEAPMPAPLVPALAPQPIADHQPVAQAPVALIPAPMPAIPVQAPLPAVQVPAVALVPVVVPQPILAVIPAPAPVVEPVVQPQPVPAPALVVNNVGNQRSRWKRYATHSVAAIAIIGSLVVAKKLFDWCYYPRTA